MNPTSKTPPRLVFAVVLIALAAGTLVAFMAIHARRQPAPVARTTLQMETGGASILFPVSIDTQQAADVGNWNATAIGSVEPVSVQAATIGTDDRTVFLEIFGLKPGMHLKVRYNLRAADGAELRGALTGKVE